MDDKNGLVDVSCFFLVEDSGDSELDSPMVVKQCQSMDIATATAVTIGGRSSDEDDAESCSCDTISTERLNDFYEVILKLLDDDDDDDDLDLIDCDGEGEEPSFGVDLCREVMDGMEDRLFWETCMAVGYP